MARNLTNLYISESFQFLVQQSGSEFETGLGVAIPSINITASNAVSSSYAVTASFALNAGTTVNTSSLLVTASVVNATITYTKGDGSTFTNTVNNVASATAAQTAQTANEVDITADATNATRYISFVDSLTGTDSQRVDAGLTYNPFTNTLTTTTVNATTFVGALQGNADTATTASLALTATSSSFATSASQAQNAVTASFALNVTPLNTGSFMTTGSATANVLTFTKGDGSTFALTVATGSAVSASFASTASLALLNVLTASSNNDTITFTKGDATTFTNVINNVSASISSSYAQNATTAVTASFATNFTASNILVTGLATIASASITNLLVIYETASVIYSSGSNQFGDASDDVQTLYGTVDIKTGPLLVSGTLNVSGSSNFRGGDFKVTDQAHDGEFDVDAFIVKTQTGTQFTGSVSSQNGFTGSLQGTASFAISASQAQNAVSASFAPASSPFPFTGSARITGSLIVTGSVTIRTGSLIAGNGDQKNNSTDTTFANNGNIVLGGWGTQTISAGYGNVLIGGANASIASSNGNWGSTVIGGSGNNITATTSNNTVVGGYFGSISAGEMGSVFGAKDSLISAAGFYPKTVFGGDNNDISGGNTSATIIGGKDNLLSGGTNASIIGSINATISSVGSYGAIVGCRTATLSGGDTMFIIGGQGHSVGSGYGDAYLGGRENNASGRSTGGLGHNVSVGGYTNTLGGASTSVSALLGGTINKMGTSALSVSQSAIIAGANNIMLANNSVILGGNNITASVDNTVYTPNVITSGSFSVSGSVTGNVIGNNTDIYTSSAAVQQIVTLTQAEYNAIGTPNVNTLYIISGSTPIDISAFATTGSNTFSGNQVFSGSVRGEVNALSIASNTASLDCSLDNFFTLQLVSGSNTFINPSNILPGQTINLRVNTTGSATVSFPSSVKQVSGSAYVPTTTTGVDIVTFISFDSTSLNLSNVKNFV
jgi:adhesin/invasin